MRKVRAIAGIAIAATLLFIALRSCGDARQPDGPSVSVPPRAESAGPRPVAHTRSDTPAPPAIAQQPESESRPESTARPETVVVEVRDRISGKPVADARLLLQADDAEPSWTAGGAWVTADKEGLAHLPAQAQPRWALVCADAVPLQARHVESSQAPGRLLVVVDSGVLLHGRLKTPSGTPAPNVPLLIYATGIESHGTGVRYIQVWQSRDGGPQWDPRDLQGRVARFRDADPIVHGSRTDRAGEFRVALARADEWTVRMLEPGEPVNLASTTIRPAGEEKIEFEFTIPDVCVARLHVALPPERSAKSPVQLRLRRTDHKLSLPFSLDLDDPIITVPAVPFRLVLTGIDETVGDEVSPAAGETIDIHLAVTQSANVDKIELEGGESDEEFCVVVVNAAGAVAPAQSETIRDGVRHATILRLARVAEGTTAIGVVAVNSGRAAAVDLGGSTREWRCALGRTGGVAFRWSDGARHGFVVTCAPSVHASYARFDESWRPFGEQGTRGLARAMVLFGVPEGTLRVRIESGGQVAFDRDVGVTTGKIEQVVIDSPSGR